MQFFSVRTCRLIVIFGGFLLTGPLVSVHAQAQSVAAPSPLMPFAQSDSEQASLGPLLTGPEATPGTCLAAIQFARTELVREPYQDTLPPAQRLDTIPAAGRVLGNTCRASFTVTNVPARELENLFLLAVRMDDTAQATAALAHWVTAPQFLPADRDESLMETHAKRLDVAVHKYLDTAVAGVFTMTTAARVQPLLQQLDALGPHARRWQLDAQASITLASLSADARNGHWDAVHILHTVLPFLLRCDAATAAERPNALLLYPLLLQAVYARGFFDPHGAATFYDSLVAASPTVAQADKERMFLGITTGQMIRGQLPWLSKAGILVPPLAGVYWYNTHGAAEWPHAGRLSLLLTIPPQYYVGQEVLAMLKRLAAQYGTRGLDITIVMATQGFWLKSGAHTGPVTPAQEAADDSAYYLGYLHLPFSLVVVPTTFTRDDEQRLVQETPVAFATAYGVSSMVVLTDRTGHLLVTDWSRIDEARLTAYIVRALGP